MSIGPRLPLALILFATTLAPRTLAEAPKPEGSASSAPSSAPSSAAPRKPASDAVHVVADKLDIDMGQKSAILEGNVRLEKGSVTMRAPRFEVRYDEAPRVTWARGTGGVVAEAKGVRAEAPELELDLAKQTLTLKGGVRVVRGAGWINADKATIDLATSKVSLSGVEGVLPLP